MLLTTEVTHSLVQVSLALIYTFVFWVHADIRLLIHGRCGHARQVGCFMGLWLSFFLQRLSVAWFGVGNFDFSYLDIFWVLMRAGLLVRLCGKGFVRTFLFCAAHHVATMVSHLLAFLVLGAFYGSAVWNRSPVHVTYMHEYLCYGIATLVLYMVVMGDELYLRKRRGIETRWAYGALLFVPPLLFILGEGMVFGDVINVPNNVTCVVASIGLFMANVIARVLYVGLDRRAARLALYSWYAQQQTQYMARMKTDQREMWRYLHDEKKHIDLIRGLLVQGENDKVVAYLGSLNERLLDTKRLDITGNADVDTVISAKYEEAMSKGITLSVQGGLPEVLPIDLVDICILLGNCLDNAMAAVRGGSKQIDLSFHTYLRMLLVRVVNACDESESFERERDNGLGLEIIRGVAARYNGSAEFRCTGGQFVTEVLLQFPS